MLKSILKDLSRPFKKPMVEGFPFVGTRFGVGEGTSHRLEAVFTDSTDTASHVPALMETVKATTPNAERFNFSASYTGNQGSKFIVIQIQPAEETPMSALQFTRETLDKRLNQRDMS